MRRHGVPIAISTDCNPGSSPLTSLLLTMNMGATLFRLTVDECIAAMTREAARALGLFDQAGSLEAGKRCDLAIWDIERPAELVYRIGFNPLHSRVWQGTPMERNIMTRIDNMRVIRAARGSDLTAKSWLTEAPMRMLMNNLDPDVAEKPGELVVYGGIGRAARDWESFDRIVATLRRLEGDQTLLVQSGKPVGVFRTHGDAPRVLIANSNIVPHWATWEHFNELDRKGLMMFGQMTAGSWIYIGSQGIVQGTYETFAELGRRHYGGSLAGRWILTAGLGGMGGAQPLAAVMAGASCLAVECQPSRIEMRLRTRYLDKQAEQPRRGAGDDRAGATRQQKPVSVGLLGNAVDIFPELVRRGVRPDAVTDQTSAHDPINGYLPKGWTIAAMGAAPRVRSQGGRPRRARLDGRARARHARLPPHGHSRRRLRQQHPPDGVRGRRGRRLRLPGLRAGLYPAAVLPRHRPVPLGRAVGRSRGHLPHRRQGEGAAARQQRAAPLARHGARAHRLPGPAGPHLLGRAGRPPSPGPRLQRDGGHRRAQGAGRDRARPSRFRLGRLAQPRNRSR